MTGLKILVLAGAAGLLFAATPSRAMAQISVSVGAAPDCPYGYYDSAPYGCAPDGYYGPEWFAGGVFVGAGPWFHGPDNFKGKVDNTYDPQHGYKGDSPRVGEKAAEQRKDPAQFKGNETRDGRGHAGDDKK
jgi:hypothetical protein